MPRTHIKDIPAKLGEKVKIKGFVQTIRDQGSIKFLMVRDVTGLIQAVILKNSPAFETANELTTESVIKLTGLVKEEKQAPSGYEIETKEIEILSKSNSELPIPVVVEKGGEETNQSTRLDWRWIDLRRPEKLNTFKVWTELENGFRKYF